MSSNIDIKQFKAVLEEVLDQKLEEKFGTFETKMDNKLEEKFGTFETKMDNKLETKLKPIHKKLNKLQRDLDATISLFDRDIVNHKHRIDRIEDHLHLSHTVNL